MHEWCHLMYVGHIPHVRGQKRRQYVWSLDVLGAGTPVRKGWIMSFATLSRLSAVSLILGGLLAAGGTFVTAFNDTPLSPTWTPSFLALLGGEMLLLLGLPGWYARQAKRAGVGGLLGFVLFFLASLLSGIGGSIIDLFIKPWLSQGAPSLLQTAPPLALLLFFLGGSVLSVLGALLLGITTLRARVYPRGAAILLLVATIANFLTPFFTQFKPYFGSTTLILISLSFAWFGYALWSQATGEDGQGSLAVSEAQS
jgi:hypothetical protein